MKKLFSIIAVMICIQVSAQFEAGSQRLHLGVGIGSGYVGSGLKMGVPPVHASYEYGISDKIGVGGLIGYTSASADLAFFGEAKYSYLIIGARGNYHFLNTSQYDVYAGAMLGFNRASVSFENEGGLFGIEPEAESGVIFGAYVGGRYNISEKFTAFAEVGYSIAWVSVGVCLNLK